MRRFHFRVSENLSYKIVALLITLILWMIIFTSKEAAVEKVVPVQYSTSNDMVLLNKLPNEVRFRVIGARMVLKKVSAENEPLNIDLTTAREGVSTIRIHADSLDLPANAKVVGIMPPMITVRLEKLISKIVPIEVVTMGQLPKGKRLLKVAAQPEIWEIFGPRSEIAKIGKVKTLPLDLSQIESTGLQDVNLDMKDLNLDAKSQGRIKVQVVIK